MTKEANQLHFTGNHYNLQLDALFHMGICGKAINIIDYNKDLSAIRSAEKQLLQQITPIDPSHILFLNQIHTDKIVIISKEHLHNQDYIADADAMITDQEDICLVIRTADCVPIIIIDPKKQIIAAVHSGWKSTKLQITAKTIEKMHSAFNCNPSDLQVYILPGIGADSYEVQMDVAGHFNEADYTTKDGSIYLDLQHAIKTSVKNCSIPEKNIHSNNLCTLQNNTDLFSHRCKDAGRNLNFIYMTSAKTN